MFLFRRKQIWWLAHLLFGSVLPLNRVSPFGIPTNGSLPIDSLQLGTKFKWGVHLLLGRKKTTRRVLRSSGRETLLSGVKACGHGAQSSQIRPKKGTFAS